MIGKMSQNAPVPGGTVLLIGFLTAMIALAAPTESRGAGQPSENGGFGGYLGTSGPPLFMPTVPYDSGGYTGKSIAVADLNGDGKLDLVIGNECASSGCTDGASVGVLLGNGDGTFQTAVAYRTGGTSGPFFPVSIAIADVNGDHKPDLVVANGGSNTVAVLLGKGDGTLQPAVTYGSGGMYPVSVAVADVNGDGKPDLFVANECADNNCDGSVGVLLGDGDGTFQPAVTYIAGLYAISVAIADVNGDGKPDLLVATNYLKCNGGLCETSGEVGVLLGNGNGTFRSAVTYDCGGRYPYSLTVADLNGDGKLDLVTADSWSATAGVLMGNGDGTFQAAVTYSSGETPVAAISSVAVADVDGDGHPDLLLTIQSMGSNGNNGGAVSVLLGNGDGTFQAAVEYASGGYQTLGVAVGDVNGDGRPDVLLASQCSFNGMGCGGPINNTRGVVGLLLNNVGAPPTTTSLVSSMNPADVNSVVTYTAVVTSHSGAAVTGMVLFQDGTALISTVPLTNNQAAYSTTYPKNGTHPITATYLGVLNIARGSASPVLTETILTPHPTTTILGTSRSPTFVGQPVTFTAKVTSTYGAIPNGELVRFFDGTTAIGIGATASGVAKFNTSSLAAKTHTIKATYIGDVNFRSSTGKVTQVVNRHPTTTTLKSSLNPSQFGQSVTFTATVIPSGSYALAAKVKFFDGTVGIGSATLSGGVAKLTKSTLAIATHPITAQYLGDSFNDKSTSSVLNQVVQ